MPCDSSAGSPTPTSFSALTRNTYSLPATSLMTRNSQTLSVVVPTGMYVDLAGSLFSMMYRVMGLPPSVSGRVQRRETLVSVTSVTVRLRGMLGRPGNHISNNRQSHNLPNSPLINNSATVPRENRTFRTITRLFVPFAPEECYQMADSDSERL